MYGNPGHKKPRAPMSKAKASKILKYGSVRGKKLTERQRRFMGLLASGKTPNSLGQVSKADRQKLKVA